MAGQTAAVNGGSGKTSTPANNVDGASANRRSSQSGSGTLFSGLINQKRGSTDAAAQARRQSFNEMKPATGFVGKIWNNFTTGGSSDK